MLKKRKKIKRRSRRKVRYRRKKKWTRIRKLNNRNKSKRRMKKRKMKRKRLNPIKLSYQKPNQKPNQNPSHKSPPSNRNTWASTMKRSNTLKHAFNVKSTAISRSQGQLSDLFHSFQSLAHPCAQLTLHWKISLPQLDNLTWKESSLIRRLKILRKMRAMNLTNHASKKLNKR